MFRFLTKARGIRSRGRYSLDEFTYDAEGDRYYCPQGKRLTPCRKPVVRSGKRYVLYRSRSVDCKACSMRKYCIGDGAKTRVIQRWGISGSDREAQAEDGARDGEN